MSKPKRAAVIGFDSAQTHMIQKHIDEGVLPNFKRLFESGVIAKNALSPFPTITPPNWATIATGATIGTHQIGDFWVPKEGSAHTSMNTQEAFSAERVQAEFIWDAVDKAGKKSIVLNYPGSWPSKMENGTIIGGKGLWIGDSRDGKWNFDYVDRMGTDILITTEDEAASKQGKLVAASGWSGDLPGDNPLEMEVNVEPILSELKTAPFTWYVLVQNSAGKGYDKVSLCPTKDLSQAFCTLSLKEWSPKIKTTMKLEDGTEVPVRFRTKLLDLSEDASTLRMLVMGVTPLTDAYYNGFCSKEGVLEKLEENLPDDATIATAAGILAKNLGWIDWETYLEISNMHDNYMAEVAVQELKGGDWDLFYMHSHSIDFTYHIMGINNLDPDLAESKEAHDLTWHIHREIHKNQDRMLGRILDAIDDDTLIVTVSDHGAVQDGPPFNPYDPMIEAGLTVLKEEEGEALGEHFARFATMWGWFGMDPDMSKSKAMPQNTSYIYINLKGREPEGIVEPEDYEKVQQEIIDTLYTYVDPATGKRPIALALTRRDARMIGLHGENVGDVVYAVYPWFGDGQHGPTLPTAEYTIGKCSVLFNMSGPGVKQGVQLDRTVWLMDLVPTVCYVMGWPVPEQAEGAVVYQALEDPSRLSNS
ncbi:MAG: hypothetical protein HOK67_11670 [Deltaproteobacteria bacterium]|jgi:predicted AlkP superfamily phosphohydrolase/phosphomutase|nr:hypothetical protein [Deltaproteobacteria bacterium]MBT6500552.1 hypothetical protein [Deltaproteobacteria bacterium]